MVLALQITDGERLPLAVKELGSCDLYPQVTLLMLNFSVDNVNMALFNKRGALDPTYRALNLFNYYVGFFLGSN